MKLWNVKIFLVLVPKIQLLTVTPRNSRIGHERFVLNLEYVLESFVELLKTPVHGWVPPETGLC